MKKKEGLNQFKSAMPRHKTFKIEMKKMFNRLNQTLCQFKLASNEVKMIPNDRKRHSKRVNTTSNRLKGASDWLYQTSMKLKLTFSQVHRTFIQCVIANDPRECGNLNIYALTRTDCFVPRKGGNGKTSN